MTEDLGTASSPQVFRGEQLYLEPRTSDPSDTQQGEAWLRTDLAPETNQLGTLRFQHNESGDTWDIPVFDTGTSATGVEEVFRVPVGGVTGYVPVTQPSDAKFPALGFQHAGAKHALHHHVEPGGVIPDSVVHHWPADEGSGTTLSDNEGTVDGTINGATWQSLADAVGGNFLLYDGTDDLVSFGQDPFGFLYSGDWTFTAYIRNDDTTNDHPMFSHRDSSSNGFNLRIRDGEPLCTVSGVQNVGSGLSVTQGQWHFVAIRFDASVPEVKFDVDDSTATVGASSPNAASSQEAQLGAATQATQYFDGGLDEATLSDSFLSDSDIQTLQDHRSDI